MKLEVFEMERFQSIWENRVAHNLSESGVHPMSLRELLDPGERETIFDRRFVYVQTNGSLALRQSIAALYPGATAENIVVGNGTAEANYIAIWRLIEPGDEVVIPAPFWVTYAEQVRMAGGVPVIVRSTLEEDWKAPVERIAAAITPRTRLLMFSSPCNPSGSVLTAAEMEALADVDARAVALSGGFRDVREVEVEDDLRLVDATRDHEVRVHHALVPVDHEVRIYPVVERPLAGPHGSRLCFGAFLNHRARLKAKMLAVFDRVLRVIEHAVEALVQVRNVVPAVEIVVDEDLPVAFELVVPALEPVQA